MVILLLLVFIGTKLPSPVNTEFDELFPYISADGKSIYFISDRSGEFCLWVTRLRDSLWLSPVNLSEIVGIREIEGPVSVSPDEYRIFFSCRTDRGDLDIYYVEKIGVEWSIPHPLPVNTDADEWCPSLSVDGRTLYFASNRKGSAGGYDIWVTHFMDTAWTKPENLKSINTVHDEISPFIHYDNKTLYFARRVGSLNDFELFVTTKEGEGFAEPVAVSPLNTISDDEYISVDAKCKKFLASYAGDIYLLSLSEPFRPERSLVIAGIAQDRLEGAPLGGVRVVARLPEEDRDFFITRTNELGEYKIVLPPGNVYTLQLRIGGYYYDLGRYDLRSARSYYSFDVSGIWRSPDKAGELILIGKGGELTPVFFREKIKEKYETRKIIRIVLTTFEKAYEKLSPRVKERMPFLSERWTFVAGNQRITPVFVEAESPKLPREIKSPDKIFADVITKGEEKVPHKIVLIDREGKTHGIKIKSGVLPEKKMVFLSRKGKKTGIFIKEKKGKITLSFVGEKFKTSPLIAEIPSDTAEVEFKKSGKKILPLIRIKEKEKPAELLLITKTGEIAPIEIKTAEEETGKIVFAENLTKITPEELKTSETAIVKEEKMIIGNKKEKILPVYFSPKKEEKRGLLIFEQKEGKLITALQTLTGEEKGKLLFITKEGKSVELKLKLGEVKGGKLVFLGEGEKATPLFVRLDTLHSELVFIDENGQIRSALIGEIDGKKVKVVFRIINGKLVPVVLSDGKEIEGKFVFLSEYGKILPIALAPPSETEAGKLVLIDEKGEIKTTILTRTPERFKFNLVMKNGKIKPVIVTSTGKEKTGEIVFIGEEGRKVILKIVDKETEGAQKITFVTKEGRKEFYVIPVTETGEKAQIKFEKVGDKLVPVFVMGEQKEYGKLVITTEDGKVQKFLIAEGEKGEAPVAFIETAEKVVTQSGPVIAHTVFFDFGSAKLRPEAKKELKLIAKVLETYKNLEVRISGHCDDIGPRDVNLRLSQKRAEAVKDYLVSLGVHPLRMIVKGYGEDRPLVPNKDEQSRQINRRVEIRSVPLSITMHNVFFDFAKADLRPEAKFELRLIARVIKENPDAKVEVVGYCDDIGSEEANLRLSLKRARAVKDFLVKCGVPPDRIIIKGYGEKRPLVPNVDALTRQVNRRVEIKQLE